MTRPKFVPDQSGEMPEWARYTGQGTMPKTWLATNPETGEETIVYRSFADHSDDTCHHRHCHD